jgi:hypothetical protein
LYANYTHFFLQDIDPDWWIKGCVVTPAPCVRVRSDGVEIENNSHGSETRAFYLATKSAKFSVVNKYFNIIS